MPSGQDPKSLSLGEKVNKFQIHRCWPNRCFRTTGGEACDACKYYFPFGIRNTDGYDSGGTRYEYMCREKEDAWVVPYNPYLPPSMGW